MFGFPTVFSTSTSLSVFNQLKQFWSTIKGAALVCRWIASSFDSKWLLKCLRSSVVEFVSLTWALEADVKRRSILETSLGCQTVTPSATLPRELHLRVVFCHEPLRMMLSLLLLCCRMDDLAVDSDDEVDYSKMDQAWVVLSCSREMFQCVSG